MTTKLNRREWYDFDDFPAASAGQSPNGKWKAAHFVKYSKPGNLVIVRGSKIIAYFTAPKDSMPVMINDDGVAALINSKGPRKPSRIDFYFPDRTSTCTGQVGAAGYALSADFNEEGSAIIIQTSKGETVVPIPKDGKRITGKSLAEIQEDHTPTMSKNEKKMSDSTSDPQTAKTMKIIGSLITIGSTIAMFSESESGLPISTFAFGILIFVCGRFAE